jgi:hypothetical protein
MSRDKLHGHLATEKVAEFLADREGLAGGARERFRRLLHEYGGFRDISAPSPLRIPIFVSSMLAISGLLLDHPTRWSDGLVWVVYTLLSVGLIWRLRREHSDVRRFDRETDWEAYCLFLRPVILSDHPGLLDRNATNHGRKVVTSPQHLSRILRSWVHERAPDLWWSALIGLWCGMVALLVTHLAKLVTSWMGSIALLGGGVLLGLTTWFLWRRLAYVVVKSDSRLVGP